MAGFDRMSIIEKQEQKKYRKSKKSANPSVKLDVFLKKVSTVGYLRSKTQCKYKFIPTNGSGPARKPTSNDATGMQGDPYFFKVDVTMTVQRGMKKLDGCSSRTVVSGPCDSKDAAKNAASQKLLDYFNNEVRMKIDENGFQVKFSK